MSRAKKTLWAVLSGRSDKNISFRDLCSMLENLGFRYHTTGSHRIYTHPHLTSTLSIQPRKAKSKGYQVKQVREYLLLHQEALGLTGEN